MTAQADRTSHLHEREERPSDASDAPVPPSGSEPQSLEDKLDEALKESFPASDPIAITPGDR